MKNETNTQHTPKNWKIDYEDSTWFSIIGDEGYVGTLPNRTDTEKANNKLILSLPELLKENEQLKELNRIQYEVTADQNLKIQDLKALNAELLDQLKIMLSWANIKDGSYSQHIRDNALLIVSKAEQRP